MCKPASGIFVKGHIAYWSKKSDRHEEIISEYKLNADGVFGTNIVRFGITPPDDDMSKPLKDWRYALDKGMCSCLPDWYDAKAAEKSARKMLKAWAKQKLILNAQTGIELTEGQYYLIDSKAVLYGNSTADLWGNSTAVLRDNSTSVTKSVDNVMSEYRRNEKMSGKYE